MLQLKQRNVKRQINNLKTLCVPMLITAVCILFHQEIMKRYYLFIISWFHLKLRGLRKKNFYYSAFPYIGSQYTPSLTGTPRLSSCDARGCFSLSVVSRYRFRWRRKILNHRRVTRQSGKRWKRWHWSFPPQSRKDFLRGASSRKTTILRAKLMKAASLAVAS